jgi:hypothetical protein
MAGLCRPSTAWNRRACRRWGAARPYSPRSRYRLHPPPPARAATEYAPWRISPAAWRAARAAEASARRGPRRCRAQRACAPAATSSVQPVLSAHDRSTASLAGLPGRHSGSNGSPRMRNDDGSKSAGVPPASGNGDRSTISRRVGRAEPSAPCWTRSRLFWGSQTNLQKALTSERVFDMIGGHARQPSRHHR